MRGCNRGSEPAGRHVDARLKNGEIKARVDQVLLDIALDLVLDKRGDERMQHRTEHEMPDTRRLGRIDPGESDFPLERVDSGADMIDCFGTGNRPRNQFRLADFTGYDIGDPGSAHFGSRALGLHAGADR